MICQLRDMSVNFCMFITAAFVGTSGQCYGKDLLVIYILVISELFKSDSERKQM